MSYPKEQKQGESYGLIEEITSLLFQRVFTIPIQEDLIVTVLTISHILPLSIWE